jgi:hypothetical protein
MLEQAYFNLNVCALFNKYITHGGMQVYLHSLKSGREEQFKQLTLLKNNIQTTTYFLVNSKKFLER